MLKLIYSKVIIESKVNVCFKGSIPDFDDSQICYKGHPFEQLCPLEKCAGYFSLQDICKSC